jgi:hypothetical protein
MLDKIRRLSQRQPIGLIEQFPECSVSKPTDKDVYRPSPGKAYLEGQELENFMDLNTRFYERKPEEGKTELFLCFPKKFFPSRGKLEQTYPKMQEDRKKRELKEATETDE